MWARFSSARTSMVGLLLLAALACSDATAPSVRAVAGTYTATRLATTTNGVTTDELAAGMSIEITLNPDGTTTGMMVVPGKPNEDLTGTWSLNGAAVRLNHSADTFLRDMTLAVRGNTLVGDQVFGGTRV